MDTALVIGGTRFIGRFLTEDLLEGGYDVTLLTRGNQDLPTAEVSHVTGDRTNDEDLERAYEEADPDLVVDMVAYMPEEVRDAVRVFSDVERYVFVSSTAAYDPSGFPKREGETPLLPYDPERDDGDSPELYGPRKAECDRIVFDAADEGVNAVSVRPTAVYGPGDPTERQDYWLDRVHRFDRVLVPGGPQSMPIHLAYVEDVASAIRIAGEQGEPGEAYNVADRYHLSTEELLELAANAMGTSVEVVHAGERDLASVGLSYDDFPLCRPLPYFVATEKLAALGWDSTPFEDGMERTVDEHLRSDRDGEMHDPGRETEEQLLDVLAAGVRFIGERS